MSVCRTADSSEAGITASIGCPMACETLCGIDYDECLSKPCKNGGVCKESKTDVSVNREDFMCTCTSTWTGDTCDLGVSVARTCYAPSSSCSNDSESQRHHARSAGVPRQHHMALKCRR